MNILPVKGAMVDKAVERIVDAFKSKEDRKKFLCILQEIETLYVTQRFRHG